MPDPALILAMALAAMAAVVAVHLYRKVAALDRRLAELEDIVGDEDAEPDAKWQACLTGPALASMVHGINDRERAMERWEQERDYESAK